MTKTFNKFLKENEAAVNTTGEGIASKDNPLFQVSRFANKKEFTVPHDHYETIKHGRDKHTKWDSKLPHPDIQAAVKKELYGKGVCIITSDKTKLSVILKHDKASRAVSESVEEAAWIIVEDFDKLNESAELTFGDDSDDEFYDPAYDYAQEHLGYNEDDCDLFAQIVLAFFDKMFSTDDGSDDEGASEITTDVNVKSILAQAVRDVDDGSRSAGLNLSNPEMVKAAMKYLDVGFELSESTDVQKFITESKKENNQ